MKRFTAIVLALMLVLSLCVVHAEDDSQWCSYVRPEGVQIYSLEDFSRDLAPAGLEGMYDVMTDANAVSNVHIFTMPNGRALLSVACYTDASHGTVQDLYDNWDSVAQAMSEDAQSINVDISVASLETRYGFDALCINTEMVPLSDPSLTLIMEGMVFYDGIDMFESWVIYPVETDTANIPLLQSDMASLRQLQESMSFKGEGGTGALPGNDKPADTDLVITPTEAPADNGGNFSNFWTGFNTEEEPTAAVEGSTGSQGLIFSYGEADPTPAPTEVPSGNSGNIFFFNSDTNTPEPAPVNVPDFDAAEMVNPWLYTDPEGHFSIWLPEGAAVITPASSTEEVAAERQRWEQAYPNGGVYYDRFQQQMYEVPYTLLSIPEHGLAWQIAYDDDPVFANATAEVFLTLQEDIRQQLEERYGRADSLDNTEIEVCAGVESASMTYAVSCEGRKMMYIVYAGVDDNGALREVDVMMLGGDDGKINPAYATFLNDIINSLVYLD